MIFYTVYFFEYICYLLIIFTTYAHTVNMVRVDCLAPVSKQIHSLSFTGSY